MVQRRRVLALSLSVAGVAGCIADPGRRCPGSTVRLSLTPVDSISDPLVLDPGTLSTAGNEVVATSTDGEHVEHCVDWDGTPGPSAGLREVGERVEAHLGIDLAGREAPAETDAERTGESYRLRLIVAGSR